MKSLKYCLSYLNKLNSFSQCLDDRVNVFAPLQLSRSLVLSSSITASSIPLLLASVATAAPIPFSSCPAPAYITQGASTSTIQLNSVDLLSGQLTTVGSSSYYISGGTNAIGFNRIDRYIYGIEFQTNNLQQISSDGTVVNLGAISGLPGSLSLTTSYVVGDVDANGILYVMAQSGSTIYGININTKSVIKTITIGSGYKFLDFAFSPVNNKLYTVENTTGKVYEINVDSVAGATGSVTPLSLGVAKVGGTTSIPTGTALTVQYGAIYFASDNSMYAYLNSGTIYRITKLSSGSPLATVLAANADAVLQNDGARCPLAPPVYPASTSVDYGDAPDGGGATGTGSYKTLASNNGPSHEVDSRLKLGATVTGDSGSLQSAAATADTSDDAFTTLPNVSTTGTYTLSNIPVTNTTGNASTLHAWVDFNKNGSFEPGEYANATVANGATTANLTWTVPAGTVVGSTYARFRLTTQALTDTAGTSEDERSIGAASDGEVEDYPVSIVTPVVASKAKLVLLKRITAIKDGVTNVVTNYSGSVADTNPIDLAKYNLCNWPTATGAAGACTNTYIGGATTATAPKVKPGDEIEYTIYYLNSGTNTASPARVCDQLNLNLTFSPQGGSGIGLSKGGAAIAPLTNVGTDSDNGQLTTPALATNCNLPNNGGTEVVVVDVSPLAGSTGAGIPTTSYGYIRFKAKIK